MTTETALQSTLADCLSQQLCEIELLKSMYPNNDDIIFTDKQIIKEISRFLSNEETREFAPNHIDFVLNLYVNKFKLEMYVNLPSFYPKEYPDINIRCNQLNRQQETALNAELSTFLKNEEQQGEVCIHTAISWVQEHIEALQLTELDANDSRKDKKVDLKENQKFCRLWIHSHHIYNKRKRDEIVNVAREYNLTGFCLPGKPGIVCVEGHEDDCKEWWKIIKSMTWQKIMIRKTDLYELSEQNEQQKFKNFEEIHFYNSSSKHSKHADMSEYSRYIEKCGLGSDFNDFFGLC